MNELLSLEGLPLFIDNLAIGYSKKKKGAEAVLEKITASVKPGELVGLIGPNGSGKSTLIRTLAGLQKPLSGNIFYNGTEIRNLNGKALAKKISVVLTERLDTGNLLVYNLVALGRHPWSGWTGRLDEENHNAVLQALRDTGMEAFKDRQVNELSDGERQKVMIARALAQETPVIMLDEPTAWLDFSNKISVLNLLKSLSVNKGKSIIISTHDIDLALKKADCLWLLSRFDGLIKGSPAEMLANGSLETGFGVKVS